jgi:hypothetical protein
MIGSSKERRHTTMKDAKRVEEFMEMVKALRNYAAELTADDEAWETNYEAMEEVDCMVEHCNCCLSILRKAMKGKA